MIGEGFHTTQHYGEGFDGGEPQALSLLAGEHAFMYAVFDAGLARVGELGHVRRDRTAGVPAMADALGMLLENFSLSTRRFTRVYAALQSSAFVLLPEAYAVESSVKPFLKFATGAGEVRNALTHHLGGLQLSFEPDTALASTIERRFPNALLRHAGAVNISLLMSNPALSAADLLLVLGDGTMELCAMRDGSLLFYNTYQVDTAEDALYYLLFMMEQFGFDPASARLCVAGEQPVDSPLMSDVKRYVRHVQPAVTRSLRRSGGLATLPDHYYFTLLNQHLCEL